MVSIDNKGNESNNDFIKFVKEMGKNPNISDMERMMGTPSKEEMEEIKKRAWDKVQKDLKDSVMMLKMEREMIVESFAGLHKNYLSEKFLSTSEPTLPSQKMLDTLNILNELTDLIQKMEKEI